METITASWVNTWAGTYPQDVDRLYYEPFLADARRGDLEALHALTRWKNTGPGGPMNLSARKRQAFDYFCSRLPLYLGAGGQVQLRKDFAARAPVWSLFWAHVLYGSPILDWRTHACYLYFTQKRNPTRKEATLRSPHHWQTLDAYTRWFTACLNTLKQADATLSERDLDRALFTFGPDALQKSP